MFHISLHVLVPLAVAIVFYRKRWKGVALLLMATALMDLDHLLADPVYDPDRCSLGFHPLHTPAAIAVYSVLFAGPLLMASWSKGSPMGRKGRFLHLVGLGLLLHIVLDGIDCIS